jgi:Ca-activated chloride channel family protein
VVLTAAIVIAKPPAPPTCQRIVIASSAEKFRMLGDFAAGYNLSAGRVATPCVTVAVEQVNSGDAERALEQGWTGQTKERPDVWAPASSAWVNLLSERSKDRSVVPTAIPRSLFKSPLVIGMPKPMADALGYPNTPVGWKDIFALVKNPAGWDSIGPPGWGQFKLGKTNPTISTSGLHALIGTYLAAAGSGSGLTTDRVSSAPVHDFVAGVEASVVHYSQTAADFLANLRDASDYGQPLLYVSAVALEEQELVDYNLGVINGVEYGAPRVSLVAIYPTEGTLVANHPYVILNLAKQAAADDFYMYLTRPEQQSVIDAHGFRNVGSTDRGDVGLSLSKFIDRNQPSVVLQPPNGAVLGAMLSAWQVFRKRARVLILVDAAADSALLKDATARLADAVSNFNPTDSAGLWVFPSPTGYATPNVAQVPVAPVSSDLKTRLRAITHTVDRPNVAASLRAAIDWMSASYDPGALDAVLLVEMSPGERTTADLQLEQDLRNQPIQRFVRLFTVGPNDSPSKRLQLFARAGRGVSYQPGSTSHLLNDVISNF